jgi:hypothetical protein
MAAKTENDSSPSKLSNTERLARKRAAARLRQQRCRARKRQVMLEQRRQQNELRQSHMSQDSSSPQGIQDLSQNRPPIFPTSRLMDMAMSSQSEPIYNCVSFESQRSFEEAHRSQAPLQARHNEETPIVTLTSSSPTRKPAETVKIADDQSEETLVPEEEAAIAAMLSLKTGPKTPKPTASESEPRSCHSVARAPRGNKFRYYRNWEPRRYESFEYGRPAYYKMPHPPAPPPHYRYYAGAYPRYARYQYD